MLSNDIGINAGLIWQLLSEKGRLSFTEIEELTGYKSIFIALALGWLARESKIVFISKNDTVYIELSPSVSEMYY